MLVDKGSAVTILCKNLFDSWPQSEKDKIESVTFSMMTATGNISPFVGKIQTNITLGKKTVNHEVLIADIKNDGILGMDFLQATNCNLNIGKNSLQTGGETLKCYVHNQVNERLSCC